MDADRIFYAFPFLFAGLWLFITTVLRKIAGMENKSSTRSQASADPGPRLPRAHSGTVSFSGGD
jgi:hypothetical protein